MLFTSSFLFWYKINGSLLRAGESSRLLVTIINPPFAEISPLSHKRVLLNIVLFDFSDSDN